MARKEFKRHNTGFICSACKTENPPAARSERNHCYACLRSMHVDGETPGDRQSDCGGIMEPIKLEHSGAKGYILIHRCEKCGKEHRNKVADDDQGVERIAG